MQFIRQDINLVVFVYRTEAKWGTQEQLTPPTDAAKNASATPRVEELAKAKTDKQDKVHVWVSNTAQMHSFQRNSKFKLKIDFADALRSQSDEFCSKQVVVSFSMIIKHL